MLYRIWKPRRSKAKVFTFRLTYGAGIGTLAASLKSTAEEAEDAVRQWAARYNKAYNYRFTMQEHMINTGYLPIVDGRTVYIFKNDRELPIAANYPVQGAAASVLYRAIYHTRRLYVENGISAWLAANVHDELLSYSIKEHAKAAMEAKVEGMRLGWLDIFPNSNTDNLVDYKIGTTWADKP